MKAAAEVEADEPVGVVSRGSQGDTKSSNY